jgi:hypothetical protein
MIAPVIPVIAFLEQPSKNAKHCILPRVISRFFRASALRRVLDSPPFVNRKVALNPRR